MVEPYGPPTIGAVAVRTDRAELARVDIVVAGLAAIIGHDRAGGMTTCTRQCSMATLERKRSLPLVIEARIRKRNAIGGMTTRTAFCTASFAYSKVGVPWSVAGPAGRCRDDTHSAPTISLMARCAANTLCFRQRVRTGQRKTGAGLVIEGDTHGSKRRGRVALSAVQTELPAVPIDVAARALGGDTNELRQDARDHIWCGRRVAQSAGYALVTALERECRLPVLLHGEQRRCPHLGAVTALAGHTPCAPVGICVAMRAGDTGGTVLPCRILGSGTRAR